MSTSRGLKRVPASTGNSFGLALMLLVCTAALGLITPVSAQSKADLLRGEYGRYRANNDLLYYHLNVRIDPDKKTLRALFTELEFSRLADQLSPSGAAAIAPHAEKTPPPLVTSRSMVANTASTERDDGRFASNCLTV